MINAACQKRTKKMVKRLNALGLNISLSRVKEIAGSEFTGRPHIARAMQEQGYINEIAEAFSESYIGRNGRAYVGRLNIHPNEGIEFLQKIGAIVVLAHPGVFSQGPPIFDEEIKPLIKNGLKGIEVYYSRHTDSQVDYYRKIALKHHLMITGGSDCHGNEDRINLNQLGKVRLPYKYVEAIKDEKMKIK